MRTQPTSGMLYGGWMVKTAVMKLELVTGRSLWDAAIREIFSKNRTYILSMDHSGLCFCVCLSYQSAHLTKKDRNTSWWVAQTTACNQVKYCKPHTYSSQRYLSGQCFTVRELSYELWQSLHALPVTAKAQWQTRSCCTGLSRSQKKKRQLHTHTEQAVY